MARVTAFHYAGEPAQAGERETRVELAACYRLVAHFGMDDLIYTHISARVPGEPEHFLINPYGMMFDEITASNLVKIDLDGNIVEEQPDTASTRPASSSTAPSHGARQDVGCVLHTHTRAGIAVSACKRACCRINQHAMFYNRVGYHDYEGIALDIDERTRLVATSATTRR